MAVDFVGNRVDGPEVASSIPVMLATQVDDFVLQCFLTVPAVPRIDAAIAEDLPAPVDSKERDIIRTIAKFSRTVHDTHSDPERKSLARAREILD